MLTSCGGDDEPSSGGDTGGGGGGSQSSDKHEWVDLGLSSGTLWATMNVGASKPEDNGDYFAWGETSSKQDYSVASYKWYNNVTRKYTKYNPEVDNKTELEPSDDAAYVNWGSKWRMPTKAQFDELRAECTWQWTGHGYLLTSKKNSKTLFLPAAGCRRGGSHSSVGSGFYWARTLGTGGPGNAYSFNFYSADVYDNYRSYGHSVRAVRVP